MTITDWSRLRPAIAGAAVHLLAVAAALGSYGWIGRHRPPVWEHDRAGIALLVGLGTAALLLAVSSPVAGRLPHARGDYLLWVGIGVLPSAAASWFVGGILGGVLDLAQQALSGASHLEPLQAAAMLLICAAAGAAAGGASASSLPRHPSGIAVLCVAGAVGALFLWAAQGLWQ